jgi:hypothetical protein
VNNLLHAQNTGNHSYSYHTETNRNTSPSMYGAAGVSKQSLLIGAFADWHANLTLYKSPDFNFADEEEDFADSHDVGHNGEDDNIVLEDELRHPAPHMSANMSAAAKQPDHVPKRRPSFHAQRDSLYSLHAYPIFLKRPLSSQSSAIAIAQSTRDSNAVQDDAGTGSAEAGTDDRASNDQSSRSSGNVISPQPLAQSPPPQSPPPVNVEAAYSPNNVRSQSLAARLGSFLSPSGHAPTAATGSLSSQVTGTATTGILHSASQTDVNTMQNAGMSQPIVLIAFVFSEIKPRQQAPRRDNLSNSQQVRD